MKKIALSILAATALIAGGAVNAGAKPAHAGGKKAAKAKKCAKTQKVGFVVKGTFGSTDGATITVANPHGNKHARRWLAGNAPSFALAGVAVSFEGVTDANADGVIDLADAQPTDQVRVIGKLARPKKRCAGASTLTVRKVKVVRETVEQPATEQPTSEQPTEIGPDGQPPVI